MAFLINLTGNIILSFSDISVYYKLFVFLIMVLGPIFVFTKGIEKSIALKAEGNIFGDDGKSKYLTILFLLLAIVLRFYKLTSFHLWPTGDEALQGFFAIDLLQKWNWHFFYTTGQHPPALIWLLRLSFGLFRSPFINLWFLPAAFSLLFVFIGYWAYRVLHQNKTALVYLFLLTGSFWPLYFGRFCVQGVLLPFFEVIAFLLFGFYLKTKIQRETYFWVGLLGLWVGVGTWVYPSWFAVILFLTIALMYAENESIGSKKGIVLLYFSTLLIGSSPWICAVFTEKLGGYILGVSLLSGFFGWKEQLLTSLSYVTCLFWGPLKTGVSFGPLWGGMLNPLLDTFFLLGATRLYLHRHSGGEKLVLFSFIAFLMPGILSADHVEMFRIIQLIPVVLFVVAMGLIDFLHRFPRGLRMPFFIGIAVLSLSMDLFHLSKSSNGVDENKIASSTIRDENYWAYQKLKPTADQFGPGLVFTDFILLAHNHSLNVACFDFNALSNPEFRKQDARWAGVITNIHYGEFLSKRYPGSHWFPITPYPVEDGGSIVGIIAVTKANQSELLHWARVHDYFHQLSILSENIMNNEEEYLATVQKLPLGYSLLSGDPFLESCYGEWMAQYHYGNEFTFNIRALQRAIEKGYPTANLYYKLGNFYYLNHQMAEAKKAYELAARSKPNYTNVRDVLGYLNKAP